MYPPKNPDDDLSPTELYLAGGGNPAEHPRTAEILRLADQSHQRRQAQTAAGEPDAPTHESLWSQIWPWLLVVNSVVAAVDLFYVAFEFPRPVQPGWVTLFAGAVLVVNGYIAARNAGRDR